MQSVNVVFPNPGTVEVWTESVPNLKPEEILCKAEKSLISTGTETYCLRGKFDPETNWESWVRYPFHTGYSMASRVIEVGSDVKDIKVGDRVTSWTPHQSHFIIRETDVFPIPDGVSDEEASWMCLATTMQVAVRRAQHVLGETVGVVGLGQLGQLVIQYVALSGASKIIGIDPYPQRLKMAESRGLTHSINLPVEDSKESILEITEGKGLDVIYDVTGHPKVLASCIQLVRKLGRVILLGDTPNPSQQHLSPGVVSRSISILGIHGTMTPSHPSDFNPWTRQNITQLFFEYLLQNRMRVSDLVTHRFSPHDAPKAFSHLATHRDSAMGVIFDWTS